MSCKICTIVALALSLVACGNDNKGVKLDVNKKKDSITSSDTYVPNQDKSVLPADKGVTDKGTKTDAAAPCTPYVATVNTGKEPCTEDTDCKTGEICLYNDAGTAGACVGKCCMDENKEYDDPANLCPVPDSAKQKAFCYWGLYDENDKPLGYDACAFICSFTDSAGKTTTYTCPNATDTCVKDTQEPTISYCDPK